MNKRERTTQPSGSGRRRAADRGVLLLPEHIELELVGIIGPADVLPGSGETDFVLVDGEDDLLAFIKSFSKTARAAASRGSRRRTGTLTPGNRALH